MIKVLELFGGIGACSKALEKLGVPFEIVDYVEIDKYAVKSFNAIHGTNFEPQDICNWDKNINVDLIMHGSPCQDFSLIGKQAGGDEGSGTRSSLMYETIRIVKDLRPKYVIWENVKNILSSKHKHNFDAYITQMRLLGYQSYYKVLNSKDYGIPQNRERVFTVSIRGDVNSYGCHVFNYQFPYPQELVIKLKDLLEDNVPEKYYLSDKMINYISSIGTASYRNCDSKINLDIARPLTTEQNKRAGTTNYLSDDLPSNYDLSIKIRNATKQGYLLASEGDGIDISRRMHYHRGTVQKQMIQTLNTSQDRGVIVENLRIRKLTPKECWRLMGFDDLDFEKASKVCSDTQLYKQAGNSIVVNVLVEILRNLLKGEI